MTQTGHADSLQLKAWTGVQCEAEDTASLPICAHLPGQQQVASPVTQTFFFLPSVALNSLALSCNSV